MAWDISAAHKTLLLPCVVKVTNLNNDKSLKMRVNDRGPFIPCRIIDVTPRAAKKLGFKAKGLTRCRVEVLSVGDGMYKHKVRCGWGCGDAGLQRRSSKAINSHDLLRFKRHDTGSP